MRFGSIPVTAQCPLYSVSMHNELYQHLQVCIVHVQEFTAILRLFYEIMQVELQGRNEVQIRGR